MILRLHHQTRRGLQLCDQNMNILFALLSHFSHVRLFATLWTIVCQAPLSKGFSRQEYQSGLPCPPTGNLPNPGPNKYLVCLLHWQAGSLPLVPPGNKSKEHGFTVPLMIKFMPFFTMNMYFFSKGQRVSHSLCLILLSLWRVKIKKPHSHPQLGFP